MKPTFGFSLFFQKPVSERTWLTPFHEAIGVTPGHKYPRFDYHNVPNNTCFTNAIFASKNDKYWLLTNFNSDLSVLVAEMTLGTVNMIADI